MRRHALIVGLFLIIGAVVNVLVAWGCSAFVNYDKATEQIIYTVAWDEGGYFSDARRTRPGFTQSIRRMKRPNGYGTAGHDYILSFEIPMFAPNKEPPVLLGPGERLRDAHPDLHNRAVKGEVQSGLIAVWPWQTSAGWPMRSMACWHENLMGVPSKDSFATVSQVTITRGLQLRAAPAPNEARVLPLQPLWAGFVVNTFFYALIAGALFFGAREMRRRHRLRRGLCPQCTYPIGVSPVCTECGSPLPPDAIRPHRRTL